MPDAVNASEEKNRQGSNLRQSKNKSAQSQDKNQKTRPHQTKSKSKHKTNIFGT